MSVSVGESVDCAVWRRYQWMGADSQNFAQMYLLFYFIILLTCPPAPTAGNLGLGKGDLPGISSVCRIYLFPLISTDLPASISTPAILQRGWWTLFKVQWPTNKVSNEQWISRAATTRIKGHFPLANCLPVAAQRQIRVKNTSYLVVLAVKCEVYTCTEQTGSTALNWWRGIGAAAALTLL